VHVIVYVGTQNGLSISNAKFSLIEFTLIIYIYILLQENNIFYIQRNIYLKGGHVLREE